MILAERHKRSVKVTVTVEAETISDDMRTKMAKLLASALFATIDRSAGEPSSQMAAEVAHD